MMSETHASTGKRQEAGRYNIRLKGHLDTRWAAWFDGLSLTHESDATTLIHGLVADQAALHGLLQKVRDLGLTLVSVTQVEPDRPDRPTTETRQLTIREGDRHGHHPNHSKETSPDGLIEEDRAGRGRVVRDHLHRRDPS
jgi:hypothetical protein